MELTKTNPDPEIDTPSPTQPHTKASLSFTNGALKRHHHQIAPPPSTAAVSYKECLKNHAASLGGHALDGCGEFMPSPTATLTDPTSLKCAACGCHRNFHRRDPEEPMITTTLFQHIHHHPPPPQPPLPPPRRSSNSTSSASPSPSPPPPPPSSYYSSAPHMLLALSTGVSGPSDDNHHPNPMNPTAAMKSENVPGNRRKRFRTKFSQEQKEKMYGFAEKLEWKMQRSNEAMVEEFCNEIGIGKSVLKVWMHNNKHTPGKRCINYSNGHNNNNGDGRNISFDTSNGHHSNGNNDNHDHHNEVTTSVHLHVSTNGSSSSS